MTAMHAHSARPPALLVGAALGTVYLVWGSTYLAIAFVVDTLPPLLAAGTRFIVAGSLLLAFLLAQDRWRRRRGSGPAARLQRPSLVHWRSALIVGGLLLLGGNGLVSVAEETIPSGIAAVIIATVPIWMSVIDALLTRRAPSLLASGGLVIGLVGVGILLLPTSGLDALDPVGIGLLMVATVAWAVGSLYARHGPLPSNGLLWTGMQQLAGGAAVLAAAFVIGEPGRIGPRIGVADLRARVGVPHRLRLADRVHRVPVAALQRADHDRRHVRLREPGGGGRARVRRARRAPLAAHPAGRGA